MVLIVLTAITWWCLFCSVLGNEMELGRRLLWEDPKSINSRVEEETTTKGDEEQGGESYFSCVDQTSSSLYNTVSKPCNVTFFHVPAEHAFSYDDVRDKEDDENVDGILSTCSILEGFEVRKTTAIMVDWPDPCVGLEGRCYDVEQMSFDQVSRIRQITSNRPGFSNLYNESTHVAIDCTSDFEARQKLQERIGDLLRKAGIAVVVICTSCSISCVVLIIHCVRLCCSGAGSEGRYSRAPTETKGEIEIPMTTVGDAGATYTDDPSSHDVPVDNTVPKNVIT